MRIVHRKRFAAMATTAALLLGTGAPTNAANLRSAGARLTEAIAPQQYHLRLHHLHTGEDIDIVYRVGNTYIPDALDQLNYFLRDHRTQDVSSYDPKEFDALHSIMARLHRPNGVIDI